MEEWSPAAHHHGTPFFLPLWTVYFQTFLNTSYCHKSRWHYWICLDSQSISTAITEGAYCKSQCIIDVPRNECPFSNYTPSYWKGRSACVMWIQMPLSSRNQPEHLLTRLPGDCDVGHLYLNAIRSTVTVTLCGFLAILTLSHNPLPRPPSPSHVPP